MNRLQSYIPISEQLISFVGNGYSLLDESSQKEVREFVESQQHQNGAFVDRAGKPELYFSLFGTWISKAIGLVACIQNHKNYIASIEKEQQNVVDRFTQILIQVVIYGSEYKKKSIWQLLKILLRRGNNVNPAYKIFMFLLVYDALFVPNKILYGFAKLGMRIFRLPKNSPCSMDAAYLIARNQLGLSIKAEAQKLTTFFEKEKGFKVYETMDNADLLSTAVALFALKRSGQDLRIVAPDCLRLIQQNYDSGAFLSGDGSMQKDLEYTFYGLLALGTLA